MEGWNHVESCLRKLMMVELSPMWINLERKGHWTITKFHELGFVSRFMGILYVLDRYSMDLVDFFFVVDS